MVIDNCAQDAETLPSCSLLFLALLTFCRFVLCQRFHEVVHGFSADELADCDLVDMLSVLYDADERLDALLRHRIVLQVVPAKILVSAHCLSHGGHDLLGILPLAVIEVDHLE